VGRAVIVDWLAVEVVEIAVEKLLLINNNTVSSLVFLPAALCWWD